MPRHLRIQAFPGLQLVLDISNEEGFRNSVAVRVNVKLFAVTVANKDRGSFHWSAVREQHAHSHPSFVNMLWQADDDLRIRLWVGGRNRIWVIHRRVRCYNAVR